MNIAAKEFAYLLPDGISEMSEKNQKVEVKTIL
jgi:hypothetical protein